MAVAGLVLKKTILGLSESSSRNEMLSKAL